MLLNFAHLKLFIWQLLEAEFAKLSHEASHVISTGDNLIMKLNSCNDARGQSLKITFQALLRNLWSQYLISIQVCEWIHMLEKWAGPILKINFENMLQTKKTEEIEEIKDTDVSFF